MEELIAKIREYLSVINHGIDTIDFQNEGLIDFVICEVVDRILLYLNCDTIPPKVERIIASIVNTNIGKALCLISTDDGVEPQAVSSISDNGQSISYTNEIRKYFVSASDEEIFAGFASLLSRYRRIKVVNSKINEKDNG